MRFIGTYAGTVVVCWQGMLRGADWFRWDLPDNSAGSLAEAALATALVWLAVLGYQLAKGKS